MSVRIKAFFMLLVAVAAMVLGCSKKSSDTSSPRQSSDPAKNQSSTPSGKPDFSTDPVSWRAEWKNNGPATGVKYQNKVIELSGVVARVGYDQQLESPCIYLKAEGESTVRCATIDKHPWLTVSPGSTVNLKGSLPTAISHQNPHLAQVLVTDPGPVKPESITAVALTKAYLADRKAARQKYNEKWVNLEGEVISSKIVAGNDMMVVLKGDAGSIIYCSIEKTGVEGARPGQKLKAFGSLNLPEGNLNAVYFYASGLTELK